MEKETVIGKLRNQLTPIYGLVDMVLMIDAKVEMKELCIEEAERCIKNAEKIKPLLSEIESRITSLESELEERKWISVEERLPEEDDHYIFKNQNKLVGYGFFKNDEFLNYLNQKLVVPVTHWMKLPTEPKI